MLGGNGACLRYFDVDDRIAHLGLAVVGMGHDQ